MGPTSAQVFAILSTDPNEDPYYGTVTLKDASGSVIKVFDTLAAPSGSPSAMTYAPTLPPGTYSWTAYATDALGASSDESAAQSFSVSAAPNTGATTRISLTSSGEQADGNSYAPSTSQDGRYVAFKSYAENLNPTTSLLDGYGGIFVRDRLTGTTTRASFWPGGSIMKTWLGDPSISGNGRYVAFEAEVIWGDQIYVRDLIANETVLTSVNNSGQDGNYNSANPSISSDGRYVAFVSAATNLVDGDNNGHADIFLRDMVGKTTVLVSGLATNPANNRSDNPSVSSDGRFIAFESPASNLVPGDTNNRSDIFVFDRVNGTTDRVSVVSNGAQADGSSYVPSISGDGRFVAFQSYADNLAPDHTQTFLGQVYVHDRVTRTTKRVSSDNSGRQCIGGRSDDPSISADGRFVAFDSDCALVLGDTNGMNDIYVRDTSTHTTTLVSVDSCGGQALGESLRPSISADARFIAFPSPAPNLVDGDTNASQDGFIHDRYADDFTNPNNLAATTPAGCMPRMAQSDMVGLEDFYPYERWDTGTGDAFVNMANGNLVVQYTDFDVVGQGLNLKLTRTYNSPRAQHNGPLGRGWTLGVSDGQGAVSGLLSALTSLDVGRLTEVIGTEDQFDFYDADGTRHHFVKGGVHGPGWHSPPGVSLALSDHLDGSGARWYKATRPDGVTYEFHPDGIRHILTRIADRKGNYLNLSYSGGKLQSVADVTGRSISFTWSGDYITKARYQSGTSTLDVDYNVDQSLQRLTSVTEAAGTGSQRTTSFSYAADYTLLGITDARGGQTSFSGGMRVDTITDHAGKQWSITYGGGSCSPAGGTPNFAICLTDPEGQTSVWTTSPQGNLLDHRDSGDADAAGNPRQNRRHYAWSGNRLRKMTDEAGNVTEYDYNPNGQITRIQTSGSGDPNVVSILSYRPVAPGVADLAEVKAAFGTPEERHWRFTYDGSGNLTSVTDPEGTATSLTYYVRGLLKTVTEAAGTPQARTTTYGNTSATDGDYHASGQPTKITDPTGAFANFSYDFLGRMTSRLDRTGKTWSYEYDLRGNQTKQIDPLGNDTWFCYDLNDNQTLVVLPKQPLPSCSLTESDAHVTRRTYDARDLLSSVLTKSSSQLRKATYTYYDDGQLKEMFEPRSFDGSGNLLATVQKATYIRYPNNRVRSLIDEEGNQTDIVYTPNGYPQVVTDPPSSLGHHSTTYTYNGRGQVKSVLESGHSQPTTHTYNLHGERTSTTTPKGNNTAFFYDRMGRPERIVDANGRQATRTYDAVGNLISFTQPAGVGGSLTTSYTYTSRGEIATESDPADSSHTVDYSYDTEGRQRFRHDKYSGTIERTVEQTYDDAGRLTQKNSTGTGLSSHRTTFSYDANGNATAIDTYKDGSLTVNVSAISIGYTTADEVSSWNETVHSPSGGSVTKSSSFAHERDGLLSSRTTDGQTSSYEHLRNGLEKKTTAFGGTSFFSSEYFPNGALKKMTLPNGTTLDQGYDLADRMISRVVKRSGGQVLSAWEGVAYDEEDNRTSEVVSQLQTDGSTVKQGTGNYSYDKLSRLTSAKHPFDPSSKAYAMDDAGNIVSDGDFSYSYSSNRLTSRVGAKKVEEIDGWPFTTQESFAYEHDHFGNVKKEVRTFTVSDALSSESSTSETTTSYNAASHTKRVSSSDGSYVDYFYDGLDRLVARLEHPVSGADVITLFFHDQMSQEIALETDGAGTAKTRYILDSTGDPLGKEEYGNSTGRSYYVEDPRGNVTQLLDSSEAVKAVFAYDPFGKEKPEHTSKVGNWDSRLRFQKAPQDPKTGAYTLGPRLYDPQINRFVGADFYVAAAANLELQIDPLTGNRYLYAGANPAGMIDDGHAPKKAKCGPKCRAKRLWKKNLDCPYLGRGIPGWCEEFRRMPPEAQGAIAATLTAAPVGVAIGGGYIIAGAGLTGVTSLSTFGGRLAIFTSRGCIIGCRVGPVTAMLHRAHHGRGIHLQLEAWSKKWRWP